MNFQREFREDNFGKAMAVLQDSGSSSDNKWQKAGKRSFKGCFLAYTLLIAKVTVPVSIQHACIVLNYNEDFVAR